MNSAHQTSDPHRGTGILRHDDRCVAIVTGSGQGIGRSIALAFAEKGADVVIADRNHEQASAVAAEIEAQGGRALAVAVDVSDPSAVAGMAAAAVDKFGRIDVLVNNAAIFSTIEMKDFDDISVQEWQTVMDVNLTGVFLCCKAVAGHMRANGYGRIINMSSATVLFGRPRYLHYVASKAGVVGITRGLARELGGAGINVNTLMPGSVDTGIVRDSVGPSQSKAIIASQSVPRRLVPDDIVAATLFLASPSSGAVTGQSLVADGGANFV